MPQGIQRISTNRPNGLNYQPENAIIEHIALVIAQSLVPLKTLTNHAVVKEQFVPETQTANISGDYGGGDPPVPIPNTEVKPSSVEDTCGAIYRENRSSPD